MYTLQTQPKGCGYRIESNWLILRRRRSLACVVLCRSVEARKSRSAEVQKCGRKKHCKMKIANCKRQIGFNFFKFKIFNFQIKMSLKFSPFRRRQRGSFLFLRPKGEGYKEKRIKSDVPTIYQFITNNRLHITPILDHLSYAF